MCCRGTNQSSFHQWRRRLQWLPLAKRSLALALKQQQLSMPLPEDRWLWSSSWQGNPPVGDGSDPSSFSWRKSGGSCGKITRRNILDIVCTHSQSHLLISFYKRGRNPYWKKKHPLFFFPIRKLTVKQDEWWYDTKWFLWKKLLMFFKAGWEFYEIFSAQCSVWW